MTQYITVNPYTEKKLASYKLKSLSFAREALGRACRAQKLWEVVAPSEKSDLFLSLAQELRKNAPQAALLFANEMGKPIQQGWAEIEKCASTCEYYAKNFQTMISSKIQKAKGAETFVTFRPLGVIFGIMPWNFPFWQAIRFAVPTLAAGNVILLKHALNTAGCSLLLEKIFEQAGFPRDVFQNLLLDHATSERLLLDPRIQGVSLTGSTGAGIRIAGVASRTLKKAVFELGGSDAYVILRDADLEQAIKICVHSRLINSGQSCIAAKRFIVEKPLYRSFTEGVVEEFQMQTLGDPSLKETTVGPLARKDLRNTLKSQVKKSTRLGARLVYESPLPEKGYFIPLTVLDRVQPGVPAFDEELFGPVAAVTCAPNEDAALALANESQFGLGGAIFSRDLEKARVLAINHMQAGSVFVNDYVKSMPGFPFGGIKLSGYGRELGEYGIHEFANIKTIQIANT